MSIIADIEKMLAKAKDEEIRLRAGIKCAAPEMRKNLLEISRLCVQGRKDALEQVKSIPKRPVAWSKSADAAGDESAETTTVPPLEAKAEVPEPTSAPVAQVTHRPEASGPAVGPVVPAAAEARNQQADAPATHRQGSAEAKNEEALRMEEEALTQRVRDALNGAGVKPTPAAKRGRKPKATSVV